MRISTLLFLAISSLVALTTPAYAYIDLATGSMILQAIVLAYVAVWFSVKKFWWRIVALFNRRPDEGANTGFSKKSDSTH